MAEFTVTLSGIQLRSQATAITKSLAALWPELKIVARVARPRSKRRKPGVILQKEPRG